MNILSTMSESAIPSRIYVGNLNFNATEDDLKEFFGDLRVASVEIPSKTITRGEKSFVKRLGFGFVQFDTEADADQAIAQYNGKEFKTRNIYAKKALPPATEEEKQKKTEAYFAKQKELKEAKKAKAAAKQPAADATADADAAPKPKKAPKEKKAPREKKDADKKPDAAKTPEGSKSKDTVFITNLDYKVNVALLSLLLKDYSPKWIHVPPRRVPQHLLKKFQAKKKPVYNKGIAFVKFADEETQLKVISDFNGKDINGREIIVEVAVDRVTSDDSASPAEATPAADAAPAASEAAPAEESETI